MSRTPSTPGVAYLRAEQEQDGSWFGRWGTNYVNGTWSVLTALVRVLDPSDPAIRRGAEWLLARQRDDGGWGEDNHTYFDPSIAGTGSRSTAFQTAWALLGLIEAGEGEGEAVRRGAHFILDHQEPDGNVARPGVHRARIPAGLLLKYHGYSRYFPLLGAGAVPADPRSPLTAVAVIVALAYERDALVRGLRCAGSLAGIEVRLCGPGAGNATRAALAAVENGAAHS